MAGYTKLFSSITDSTIWREPDRTRLVWITMLAMADANGIVSASIPGLADRSRVPLEDCLIALNAFMSEDQWSRSKEYAGRRIEEVDGGWILLNHQKYRAIQDAEHRKEQARLGMQRLRAERAAVSTVNTGEQRFTQAEAEAEPLREVPTALVATGDAFRPPDCPFQELLAAYHELCPSMSQVRVMTNMRMKHCRARWIQVCTDDRCGKDEAMEFFRGYFRMAQGSRFLTGRTAGGPYGKDRAWKADFEWLMTAGNFAKVVEGKYNDERTAA